MVECFCVGCDHEHGDYCKYEPITSAEPPKYCPISGNECKWEK